MKLNLFTIKILAIIIMTIDHIGMFFETSLSMDIYLLLRTIGRIAFPLFAFAIAEGFKHSSNLVKYFTRLFLFALIIDCATYFIDPSMPKNIFYTLALGLLCLIFLQRKRTIPLVIVVAVITYFLDCEYSLYGIALIMIFGTFKNINTKICIFIFTTFYYCLFGYGDGINFIQSFAVIASFFIFAYNGERGPSMKYFFYLYYPLHMIILYSIANLI